MKKRGIHFNRLWQNEDQPPTNSSSAHPSFRLAIPFIATVYLINLFLIYPLLNINVAPSFSSSSLWLIASLIQQNLHISQELIFKSLTFIALSSAPVSFYFFVKKILKYDLTAFMATLLFILPNPFFTHGLPMIDAVLAGDGSHAIIFALLPLLFLSIQNFIAKGDLETGIISAFTSATFAIISLFSLFDFVILLFVITAAETLSGQFKAKTVRLLFLLTSTITLSAFWYFPDIITKTDLITQIQIMLGQIGSLLPIAIPLVPIIGILFFLVFSKSYKIKVIFLVTSLFLIYYSLFIFSKSVNTPGLFSPDRYLIELSFAASLLLASFCTFPIEHLSNRLKNQNGRVSSRLIIFLSAALIFVLIGFTYIQAKSLHTQFANALVQTSSAFKFESITASSIYSNPPAPVSNLLTLSTAFILLSLLIYRSSRPYLKAISSKR